MDKILILAVVLFVIAIIGYFWNSSQSRIPTWVWVLFFFSVLLALIAPIASSYDSVVEHEHNHSIHSDGYGTAEHTDVDRWMILE